MNRIKTIQQIIAHSSASAAIISSLTDIRWACGFSGSNALMLVTLDNAWLITDGRYTVQSRNEVTGAEIGIADGLLIQYIKDNDLLPADGEIILQAEHTTLSMHSKLVQHFGDRDSLPKSMLLSRFVAVKNDEEIASIARAQSITDDVFEHLLGFIKPGMTEREVSAEIAYQHLRRGASGQSFETIVASGPNGALPHARPTDRKLLQGELIVMDFGCLVNGYASDMTRTIALGKPSDEAVKVYNVVREAQEKAVAEASPKLTTNELDAVARSVIEAAGYGDYFSHSLGHGVGLDIHEWPRVSWQTNDRLAANMAITIEPGIYLPGQLGVRIEDIIILKENGCDVLTRSTKELCIL